MGCDIHLFVETKTNGPKWASADTWRPADGERTCVDYERQFYKGRNYDLFAMLANVRNGHGVAGVDTGDGFVPIAMPRGLPEDVSPEVLAESDGWDCDGHSHSFFTVVELLAYDWTRTTKKRGWVNGPEFAAWSRWDRGQGFGPKRYSGGVAGGGITHIDIGGMQLAINDAKNDEAAIAALASTYTQVQWETPYYRSASNFLSETLPRLWKLGAPADVRIVFWFDN